MRLTYGRRARWLPQEQNDLESWLAGHRERVEARGEQLVLHPVRVFESQRCSSPRARSFEVLAIYKHPPGRLSFTIRLMTFGSCLVLQRGGLL
jgi:hypothetical protein